MDNHLFLHYNGGNGKGVTRTQKAADMDQETSILEIICDGPIMADQSPKSTCDDGKSSPEGAGQVVHAQRSRIRDIQRGSQILWFLRR